MKAICPKCREVIDLDDLIVCDEQVDFDEFEQADEDNKEYKGGVSDESFMEIEPGNSQGNIQHQRSCPDRSFFIYT